MSFDPRAFDPERALADVRWMRRLASSLVGASDADDLAQDAWLAATRWRDDERPPPRRWLAAIVRNLSIRRARSESGRAQRERSVAREERLASTDELAARIDVQRRLAEAVLRLSEPYRSTVILRYTEELEPSEIARRQGVAAGTVRSRLKRALEMLREDLDRGTRGDRSAWMSALAPFALRWRGAASGSATAAAGGALAMKKLIVAALVLVFAGSWWFRSTPTHSEPRTPNVAVHEIGLPDERQSTSTVGGLDEPLSTAVRRTPVTAVDDPTLRRSTNAPGWWLVATVRGVADVRGIDAIGTDPLHVSVHDALAQRLGSNADPIVVATDVTTPLEFELDLSQLFSDAETLPEQLVIDLDHSGCAPAHLRVPVTREQRQRGYLPGGRSEIAIDVDLAPAKVIITGTVKVPTPITLDQVRVELRALEADGSPERRARDAVSCDAHGDFRMRAPAAGDWCLVAYTPLEVGPCGGAIARPQHRLLHIAPTEAHVACDFELTLGATITGLVSMNGKPVAIPWWVCATRVDEHPAERPSSDVPSLSWVGESFEHDGCAAVTDEHGRFRITGLTEGAYKLEEAGAWAKSHTGALRLECSPTPTTVHSPTTDVELRVDCALAQWQVVSSGTPVPQASVVIATSAHTSTATVCDDEGRIRFACPAASAGLRATFSKPGYVSRSIDVDMDANARSGWTRVELERDAANATLRIRLEGDARRTAERFQVELHAKSRTAATPKILSHLATRGMKRDAEGVTVSDVAPGCWSVVVEPMGCDGRPALDTWVMPVEFDVELLAGETKTVTTVLEEGGRLRFSPAKSWGPPWDDAETVIVRVLDEHEREVHVKLITGTSRGRWKATGAWGSTSKNIPVAVESEMFPSLSAGTYSIVLSKGGPSTDHPDRRFDVTIEQGKTVELDLAKVR